MSCRQHPNAKHFFLSGCFADSNPHHKAAALPQRKFTMKVLLTTLSAFSLCLVLNSPAIPAEDAPIRILLVTGGCCHDYDFQTKAMQKALKDQGIAAEWKVVNEGGKGTSAEIPFYENPEWAYGYDVVVHNECFANTSDPAYIRKITGPHKAGINAVVIHCAMHTYRSANVDDWREFLGVTSKRHDHQAAISAATSGIAKIIPGFEAKMTAILMRLRDDIIEITDGKVKLVDGYQGKLAPAIISGLKG